MGRKTAQGDEAAAVAAAIARFEAEVGATAGETTPPVDKWQRAALIEGVSAKETVLDSEGGARWQS
ncbi:MAG TPA: hypothetical protein VEW07_06715 [Solirubrobacterales bacterium]|nr:hypothetical protein [Solirubrobacterales bacterium]